jgi:hypothetical protein
MGFGFRLEYIREKIALLVSVSALFFVAVGYCAPDRSFHLTEASIADIHKAMQAGVIFPGEIRRLLHYFAQSALD